MEENYHAEKCAALMKLKLDPDLFFGFYEVEKISACKAECDGRLCLSDDCDGRCPIEVSELRGENKNA